MTPPSIPSGLYDLLLTQSLEHLLSADTSALHEVQSLEEYAAEILADTLVRQLAALLEDLPDEGAEAAQRQLTLVNELLVWLRQRLHTAAGKSDGSAHIDLLATPARLLRAVHRTPSSPTPPALGLAAPWLFTSGKGSPSLLHEIRRELASCDRVDILVSFITVSGVRKLQDVIQQITAQGAEAGSPGLRIRILTTTYTGATEVRALDELARLPGCEVRVSLNGRRTRLHAKAWMLHRATSFGSAYIGSANLTGAALTGGLEWTVKLAQRGQTALFTCAEAHFETLWADHCWAACPRCCTPPGSPTSATGSCCRCWLTRSTAGTSRRGTRRPFSGAWHCTPPRPKNWLSLAAGWKPRATCPLQRCPAWMTRRWCCMRATASARS